mgnify:CR=1 FL=1
MGDLNCVDTFNHIVGTLYDAVLYKEPNHFSNALKDFERTIESDSCHLFALDRIGRDSIDVQQTIQLCTSRKIRVVVLQLGNLDLTSSSGALIVKLPGSDSWNTFEAGSKFTVEANSKFQLKVAVDTAYLCEYRG